MAPALTDGVPGLEGLHTLTPPSPFSAFTLNDWMDPSTGLTRQWTNQTAHTLLLEVQGLYSKPDADDPRVALVYQKGELPLPRLPRGRTITYSGIVAGETLSAMRAKIAALNACCNSALQDPTAWYLSVAYDSTYDTTGLAFRAYGIPTAFDCDERQPAPSVLPSPYQREFSMSFRQSDGRWWITPSSFLCSVGSSSSKINDGTSGTLTMTGTADSEPTFTVYGTGSGEATIRLTASEISAVLQIVLPTKMASGDTLVVNFGQRTITYTPSGGSPLDYSGYLDLANSNWWNEADVIATLLVGNNTLEVQGDKWSCQALPACW